MSFKRRLENLEERLGTGESLEDAINREVMRRMTTAELRHFRDALKRLIDGGEPYKLTEEDIPIWRRRQELYEEVSREFSRAQA